MKNIIIFVVVLFGTLSSVFAQNFLSNPTYSTYYVKPFTFNPELGYMRLSDNANYLFGKVSLFGNFEDSDFLLGGKFLYAKNVLGDYRLDTNSNRIHIGLFCGYRQVIAANANPYTPQFIVGVYGNGNTSGIDKRIENVGFMADIVYPINQFTIFFKYSIESRDLGNKVKKSPSSIYAGVRSSLIWKPKMFLDVAISGETDGTSDKLDGISYLNSEEAKFHLQLESSFAYNFHSTYKVKLGGKLSFTPTIASGYEGYIGFEDWNSGFNFKLSYLQNGDLSYNQNVLRIGLGMIIH